MRRIRNDGQSGVKSQAAARRRALRAASPPWSSARSRRLQVREAVLEAQGLEHVHQVLRVVHLWSIGFNQQLGNGKANQQEEDGEMEESRR